MMGSANGRFSQAAGNSIARQQTGEAGPRAAGTRSVTPAKHSLLSAHAMFSKACTDCFLNQRIQVALLNQMKA